MSCKTTDTLPGYQTKIVTRGSFTVNIHRPVLTDQERSKREKQIKDTLGIALRDYIGEKENGKRSDGNEKKDQKTGA